jgi:selenide,water dikinase
MMEALTLLPDPQTNGGLLLSVKEESLEEVKKILVESIVPIGKMVVEGAKTVWVK